MHFVFSFRIDEWTEGVMSVTSTCCQKCSIIHWMISIIKPVSLNTQNSYIKMCVFHSSWEEKTVYHILSLLCIHSSYIVIHILKMVKIANFSLYGIQATDQLSVFLSLCFSFKIPFTCAPHGD